MWPYFGSKLRLARYYPGPVEDKIIEPFAGTAGYSLKYFDRDVLLVDKYPVIIGIWRYLQASSPEDILRLPRPLPGQDLRAMMSAGPARDLLAFLTQIQSAHRTYVMADGTATRDLERRLRYIAGSLYKIRGWKFQEGDYRNIPNQKATWFIDPPYQVGGDNYIEGNKGLDYAALGDWARARAGQVIVCENTKADWLDFRPMRGIKSIASRDTTEAIWSNRPTAYDYRQLDIFGNSQTLTGY